MLFLSRLEKKNKKKNKLPLPTPDISIKKQVGGVTVRLGIRCLFVFVMTESFCICNKVLEIPCMENIALITNQSKNKKWLHFYLIQD